MAGKVQQFLEKHRTSTAAGGMVALGIAILMWRSARPTNERPWIDEMDRMPTAEFDGDTVTIKDIRNFLWSKDEAPTQRYETRTYDLGSLVSLDFILSRFGKMKGLAGHTLLSFGFEDGRFLTVSVEIRRETGQHYSFLRGLFRHYELMYVLADELDIIRLRTNIRQESTFLFPVKIAVPQIRDLFVSILKRANLLAKTPEFYHSIKNSCTTNLIGHFNEIGLCKTFEYGPRAVFSGLADGLLRDLGLIGDGTKLKELRKKHAVTHLGVAYGDGPEYSRAIRGGS